MPKLRKNTDPVQGRPIAVSVGSLFEALGQWIDQCLQPLIARLPGYIRHHHSTSSYKLYWQESFCWVTMDVKSLYSCITHDRALHALKFHLNLYSMHDKNLQAFIIMSVAFLLEHNYFMINQMYFLRCRGASMGAMFSPSLANLYMGWWKENFFFPRNNRYVGAV